jgi:serine/threonine-protein kinase RsbW
MQVYQHTFEGQVEQLAAIREFIQESVIRLGAGEEDAFACQLAADEAATNAFKHAYAGGPGRLEVIVWCEAGRIALRLRNWGVPFDPEAIPVPGTTRPLEERPAGGLGIFLMRKFMDEVQFSFAPQEGNTVTMQRRLGPRVE